MFNERNTCKVGKTDDKTPSRHDLSNFSGNRITHREIR